MGHKRTLLCDCSLVFCSTEGLVCFAGQFVCFFENLLFGYTIWTVLAAVSVACEHHVDANKT